MGTATGGSGSNQPDQRERCHCGDHDREQLLQRRAGDAPPHGDAERHARQSTQNETQSDGEIQPLPGEEMGDKADGADHGDDP